MENVKYSDLEQYNIVHNFEYYDFPLFFIAESPKGELLLNYYIEEVEDDINKWLFSKITNKEREDLIGHRISVLSLLRKLYSKKRLFHLYLNTALMKSDTTVKLEIVTSNNFDPESFPEEDFFVEYDYVTKRELVKVEQDIVDSSRFKMVLRDDRNSHDISLDVLLEVLEKFKKSINDMAHDFANNVMGEGFRKPINLRVDSVQPSSFAIWLMTEPSEADLFEVPEHSLNNFFDLLDDIHRKSPEEIEEAIEIDGDYSLTTIKAVKDLLKEVVDSNFTLGLEADTKINQVKKEVVFGKESYSKIHVLTNILSQKNQRYTEEIEVDGTLISVNTKTNHFRISTDDEDFSGKMSADLFKRLKEDKNITFRVPSKINAVIEKEVIKNYVEDEHKNNYVLLAFTQSE